VPPRPQPGSTAWPRQPFIGVALACVGGIALADVAARPAIGIALAIGLAAIALARRSSFVTYLFVAASFFFLHSVQQTRSPGVRLARELGGEPIAIAVRGLVVSEPKFGAMGSASFRLKLRSLVRDGRVEQCNATILGRWRGDVRYGDELQLFGVVQPVEGPRNPGEFDMRAYLARQDIRHAIVVRYPENGRILSRGGGSRIMRAAQASRNWMQASLARGLEDSPDLHGLISGMVLGVRDDTPDEIEEQFQQTGTLHLFAVSGLNVAIVAQLLWVIATAVRLPRRWAIALIIPALFFYAAVTGLNASSIRAALMASLLLAGFFVDRRLLAANSVAAAAVIVLCFDPNQLFSTGFQLSFAVVVAILLLGQPLFKALVRWCEPDPFLPKSLLSLRQRAWQFSWRAIAGGASVSLAAWVGSLPLILPYFYLITPVSLFANLVVVPLAFLVLAVGLISLLLTPVAPWLAIIFNNANLTLAAAILGAVGLFTRAPAGHFYLELPRWPSGAQVELTALDLGPGAAIHVRTRHDDWLIDCGADSNFKRTVRGYLRSRGINRLDGLILTHGDSRHIGAAATMMRVFRPRELIDSAPPDRSSSHRALIKQLDDHHIARQLCAADDDIVLAPNVRARVLFPPQNFQASRADDQALVLQLLIDNRWRVLCMSDSGEPTERALLARDLDLRSDVLIKGQNHSSPSGTPEFLDRVQPRAIIAAGLDFPENERIRDDWAADVEARGIKLLRQDQIGAVALRFWRDHWEAKPYLRGEIFRNDKR
jgi:ComEC/Rec2-related protein